MFKQFIAAEIIYEIPDNRMNMVRVILGIIVLNNDRGALDAVIVRVPAPGLLITGPGEAEIIQSFLFDILHHLHCK
jgi:hypothetical protein